MSVFDSSPSTPLVVRADRPLLDERSWRRWRSWPAACGAPRPRQRLGNRCFKPAVAQVSPIAGSLDAVGVGQQLRQLRPVGVAIEKDPDDIAAPARLEVRQTKVFEGQDLVGLGAERDPEELVLAAEGMGDGGLTHPPSDADPGTLLDAFGKAVEQAPEPSQQHIRQLGSLCHGHKSPMMSSTDMPAGCYPPPLPYREARGRSDDRAGRTVNPRQMPRGAWPLPLRRDWSRSALHGGRRRRR